MRLLQRLAGEEIGCVVILAQHPLLMVGHHGSQLMQIAYHEQLHASKGQIMLAVSPEHGIDGIEQIAPHHTDFVYHQEVDRADDFALQGAKLIFFLLITSEGSAWEIRRQGQLEERMNRHATRIDGSDTGWSQHHHSFRRLLLELFQESSLSCSRFTCKKQVSTCFFNNVPCQDGFFVHFHLLLLDYCICNIHNCHFRMYWGKDKNISFFYLFHICIYL